MIHVCFGLYDKTGHYSKFTGTAMLSLFDNTTSNVTVHILHDNTLTDDNREKFSYVAGRYGQRVKFYNVEKICADKISNMVALVPDVQKSRVSVGAFYRLLIPNVLPENIDRCIYFDSDIIVNLDISDLWRVDLDDKPLAAVPEDKIYHFDYEQRAAKKYLLRTKLVSYKDYFNSGVIIINLNFWRQNEQLILSGVKWRGDHPQCACFDQDIFNYLFSKNYVRLSENFDLFVDVERRTDEKHLIRRAIYHYIYTTLRLEDDPYNRLWMDYFIRTPWFDAETIGKIFSATQQLHVDLKNSMAQISAIVSGKTRAFFAAPADIDSVRKIFAVRPDEEIIPVNGNESLQKLVDAMKNSRGRKIFFIVVPKFPFQILIQAGFVPGRDFINGMEFLSEVHGKPLDSYPLIKSL